MASNSIHLGLILFLSVCVCIEGKVGAQTGTQSANDTDKVIWAGEGKYRFLVEIDPKEIGERPQDEMPAELEIDFVAKLSQLDIDKLPNIASIQVIQYDPNNGQPVQYGNYAYGKSEFDRPFRWLDGYAPYQFPEFQGAISRKKGKIDRQNRIRGGFFLQTLGDWKQGRLTWLHTQTGINTAWYAVYFDLLPQGSDPSDAPPRGWIGDGLPRCDRLGSSTVGSDHARVELDDWNGDGLIDLVVGENYGHVLWWPNQGSRNKPRFPYARFVFGADGLPLDAGQASAPKVVDWDGDGVRDLLVGTHWNRVAFYRNEGTNRDRRLVYRGCIELGAQPFQLPVQPLERGNSKVFKRDYYPVLETVDWDDDGDLDLLAGGYITGRIFFYENTGRDADGLPKLTLVGPVQADGKPLNVKYWCAAPCIADFDDDGDLDLISGRFPMYEQTASKAENDFLKYYENVGLPGKPDLRLRPFPCEGEFPPPYLSTPRAHDWDDDGDLDLVVSAQSNIYLFKNKGNRKKPKFQAHATPLPAPWGSSNLQVDRFLDFNGDGRVDLVKGYTVKLNSGIGNPWQWDKAVSLLPRDQFIRHPSNIGDDWFWPYINDFDNDHRFDVLFGDWHGHIWLHRNLSTDKQTRFDLEGERLKLVNEKRIKVGPIGLDPSKDFTALQGARTVLTTADFDQDGLNDLVVGDTYGKIRYFRNAGTMEKPVFASPIEVGDLRKRLLVDSTDWNGDGWMDVIAGSANGQVRVFLNHGKSGLMGFAEGFDPMLPPIAQPRVLMADLNGDGDEDLFVPSTQGSCFVERSFLSGGYAKAKLIEFQRK